MNINRLFSIVLILITGFILFSYKKQQYHTRVQVVELEDSLSKVRSHKDYITHQLKANYSLSGFVNPSLIYQINPVEKEKKKDLIKPFKRSFVIRYSEYGCNSCINMVVRNQEYLKELKGKYNVIILGTFSNNEALRKWKKMNLPEDVDVRIIEPGTFKYDEYYLSNSYIFIIEEDLYATSFFSPNNLFPEELKIYLQGIL